MREAGRISGNAINEVIRRGLLSEREIEATLDWLFRMGGCDESAYVPVVAGGKVPPQTNTKHAHTPPDHAFVVESAN